MYTTHGHHIQGTDVENPPPSKARCGGPVLCNLCASQSMAAITNLKGVWRKDSDEVHVSVDFFELSRERLSELMEFLHEFKEHFHLSVDSPIEEEKEGETLEHGASEELFGEG